MAARSRAISSRPAARSIGSRVGFRPVLAAWLPESRPQRHRRATRSPTASPAATSTASRSTRASISTGALQHRERLRHRHAVDRRQLAHHRRRAATTRRRSTTRPHQTRHGRARSTATTRSTGSIPRPASRSTRRRRSERVRRLQRRQPRADVDRTRLRRPGSPCKLPNAHGRRSAARSGRHQDGRSRSPRRHVPTPDQLDVGLLHGRKRQTTSCSCRPTQTGFGYFKNFGKTRRQRRRGEPQHHTGARNTSAAATHIWTRRTKAPRRSAAQVTARTMQPPRDAEVSTASSRSCRATTFPSIPAHTFKAYADDQGDRHVFR